MGDSTCVACGECVQACPTGALMPATWSTTNQVATAAISTARLTSVCPFCGVGCQVSLKVKDGKIKYVEGINGPANEGRLCVKGRFRFRLYPPQAPADQAADPPRGRARQGAERRSRQLADPLSAKQPGTRRWTLLQRPRGATRRGAERGSPASAQPNARTRKPICSRR